MSADTVWSGPVGDWIRRAESVQLQDGAYAPRRDCVYSSYHGAWLLRSGAVYSCHHGSFIPQRESVRVPMLDGSTDAIHQSALESYY